MRLINRNIAARALAALLAASSVASGARAMETGIPIPDPSDLGPIPAQVQVDPVPSFADVPAGSPYYAAVEALKDAGIVNGVPGGLYMPDERITLGQACAMACRARGVPVDPAEGMRGYYWACVENGWFFQQSAEDPLDVPISKGALLSIVLLSEGYELYDGSLFPGGKKGTDAINAFRIARELGIIENFGDPNQFATRGYAAMAWRAARECEEEQGLPPVMEHVVIENRTNDPLYGYVAEIARVPEPVLDKFAEEGYSFVIETEIQERYGKDHDMAVGGLFVPAEDLDRDGRPDKRIYVNSKYSVIHEFGHFIDFYLGRPSADIKAEKETGRSVGFALQNYAQTNEMEFYACYYNYLAQWGRNEGVRKNLQLYTPRLYEHFQKLEELGYDLDEYIERNGEGL